MLSDYPVKFNGEAIPQPVSWSESSDVIEAVNETEAGTDQIIVTRFDKLTISCSFQCSSLWAKKFKTYSKLNQITVNFYDVLTEAYKTRTMRIRNYKVNLVDNSWHSARTNGLWEISFDLIEF